MFYKYKNVYTIKVWCVVWDTRKHVNLCTLFRNNFANLNHQSASTLHTHTLIM